MRKKECVPLRRWMQRHRLLVVLLAAILVMEGLAPGAGCKGGNVYAAEPETKQFELDVTDKTIYYGDWFTRVMYFKFTDTGEREKSYCMNPELVPPSEGVHTARIYNYKNVPDSYRPLWKALYYLEGGEGYAKVADVWDSVYHYDPDDQDSWAHGRDQAYALSHMVVSELSPVGSGGDLNAGETYVRLKKAMIAKINTMPDPPKTFQIAVYVSGSGLQNLSGYCAPLSITGSLQLQKVTADTEVEGNDAYSLSGAVYGVYEDKELKSQIAELVTDGNGKTDKVSLDEGTYYVKEKKASKGYTLDPKVYTVTVDADETASVTSKETPEKGILELVKYSDAPEWTADNEQYSLENAEYAVYRTNNNGSLSGKVGTFTTDKNGKSKKELSLYAGTYYVKETKPPKGFDADPSIHKATVKVGTNSEVAVRTSVSSTDEAKKGMLQLQKESANTGISEQNRCYSLAGAMYGIYRSEKDAEKDANRVDTLTTNEDGNSQVIKLYGGDYFVKEIVPSEGFALDQTIYQVHVTIDEQSVVISKEEPKYDPVRLLLEKIDKDTGGKYPQGGATLEGAFFAVEYYDQYLGNVLRGKQREQDVPLRTWIFRTDENGEIQFNEKYLVEGDPFYCDQEGRPVLPLGTVRIREIKPPEGYKKNDTVYECRITDDGNDTPIVETYFPPEVPDEIKRGDLKGVKIYDGTAGRGGQIVFRLTSVTTGESHIIVTDENGQFDTSSAWAPHSMQVNKNDDAVPEDGEPDVSMLDDASGIWFAGRAPGDVNEGAPVDDGVGALPYDEYVLDELPCPANAGYQCLTGIHIRIRYDEQEVPARGHVDLGTLTNDEEEKPDLKTEACDKKTGTHEGNAQGRVTIIDNVTYKGLEKGKRYTISGMLMDRTTGRAIQVNGKPVNAEYTFVATRKNGSIKIPFTTDASALKGRSIVVFETLFQGNIECASHRDLTDDHQTVSYPEISTRAGIKEQGTITDQVSYNGLVPGKTYHMTTTLYDPSDHAMVDGKEGTVVFCPDKSRGHVDVTVDSTGLEGETLVVYETVSDARGNVVAEHKDPACAAQTVTVPEPEKPDQPVKPEKPEIPSKPHVPRTGDPYQMTALLILLLSAAGMATAGFAWRRQ